MPVSEHRSGKVMDSRVWEPFVLLHPWEQNFYVVCTCGKRTDHEDPWELVVAYAMHVV